ncbi:MAG: DegT/DnrJ/EryC1/StrS family aminotransferase [Candidatus Omnitrophica bacterium]|nr:DegT/DnrJ/EryC1/StrS family aminotransferase [Candidatus Omnitrophota bacterium]
MNVPGAKIVFFEEDKDWILKEVRTVLDTGQLTLGRHGRAFEEDFASAHGARYAVATNSGTSSLEIILRAIGVEGREVIVPTNTFFATAAAVVHAGATPVFADIGETFALTPETIEERLTPKTAAVMLVHIGGMITPDIAAIQTLCRRHRLVLVEDAAHAHGSSRDGRLAGTFGAAGSFSFYPTKIMTSGEGGMIVTDDEAIRNEALIYRDQGKKDFSSNFHVRMGYNWRMSELHAIVGLAQLKRLKQFIAARTRIARIYDEGLGRMEGITPVIESAGGAGCYYKYLAVLDDGISRPAFKKLLREKYGVALSGEVYETPLHRHPVFEAVGKGAFPVAERLCARHICLPIFSDMTEAQAEYVLESLKHVIASLAERGEAISMTTIGGVR